MKIRIIIPIYNLTITDMPAIDLGKFSIIDPKIVRASLDADIEFQAGIGIMRYYTVTDNHLLYFAGESDDLGLIKYPDNPIEIARVQLSIYEDFIQALWFHQDNSIFIKECYISVLGIGTHMIYTESIITNSEGNIIKSNWQGKEIMNIATLTKQLKAIQWEQERKQTSKPLPEANPKGGELFAGNVNKLPYQADRITRAISLLSVVRANVSLIVKITYHIAIYESIFTTNTPNKTEKVSRRVSSYLSTKESEIKKNYYLIIEAYNIRSRYIHGDNVVTELSNLTLISKSLDSITRKILLKLPDDKEIFLSKSSKKFEEHFETITAKYNHLYRIPKKRVF